jgi:hypothetical protein
LKKAAQKLLAMLGLGRRNQHGPKEQKTTFCSRKVAFPSLTKTTQYETMDDLSAVSRAARRRPRRADSLTIR